MLLKKTLIAISLFVLTATIVSAADTGPEPKALDNPETIQILESIRSRVGKMFGIEPEGKLPAYSLDNELLEHVVRDSFATQFPPNRQRAFEEMLISIKVIPEGTDILEMFLALLGEQVGGLYDPHSKRFFVREGYDVRTSSLARTILAHEIIHSLQDQKYDLRALGIESSTNDDQAFAISAIAEGDATIGMGEYSARFETKDILGDLPEALSMDQTALEATPHFFQQMLLWPYIAGQLFVQEAQETGSDWRDRIFTNPPQTTEQIIHPEKYFDTIDLPTTVSLLTTNTLELSQLDKLGNVTLPPDLNKTWELIEMNRFGEIGTRLVIETHLGTGIATQASAGWDGDAYGIYYSRGDENEPKDILIVWETVWDTPRDAQEFVGAWVTLWRTVADERKLGSLTKAEQTFKANGWDVTIHRDKQRVSTWWTKTSNDRAALDN